MPLLNRTGPRGKGPRTGRGLGTCKPIKRKRPAKHYRKVKTKRGRKKVLVNRYVKKRPKKLRRARMAPIEKLVQEGRPIENIYLDTMADQKDKILYAARGKEFSPSEIEKIADLYKRGRVYTMADPQYGV